MKFETLYYRGMTSLTIFPPDVNDQKGRVTASNPKLIEMASDKLLFGLYQTLIKLIYPAVAFFH